MRSGAEHLQLAAEIGVLAVHDIPANLMDVVTEEDFYDTLVSAAVEAEGLEVDSVKFQSERLENMALRECQYPSWLSCSRKGVVVAGLRSIELLSTIVTTRPLPDSDLPVGTRAVVVEIHNSPELGYEIEVVNGDDTTIFLGPADASCVALSPSDAGLSEPSLRGSRTPDEQLDARDPDE